MTGTTPATLGEQALRRLGIAVVPVANRPQTFAPVEATVIATRALVALGVIASDETPSASDLALAIAKLDAVHDAMVLAAFVTWDVNHVPQGCCEEYVLLTALHLATSFGKTGDPAQQPVLEARVRKVQMVMQAPAEAERAVMAVHQDWASRGMVRWTVFDIPPAAERSYVFAAAFQLAALYGAEADPKDMMQAEQAIYRYIALPTSGERVIAEYF